MPEGEKRQWREEEDKDADGRVMAPKPQQLDEAACAWSQGSWGVTAASASLGGQDESRHSVSIFLHTIPAPLMTQQGHSLCSVLPSGAVSHCETRHTSQLTANDSVTLSR